MGGRASALDSPRRCARAAVHERGLSNGEGAAGRRLESPLGPPPFNWVRLQEVDSVIRPWIVRRECIDRVGPLDEVFVPTEWDEVDLGFRLRAAGWKVATCGYERLGGYQHLGSSTLGALSDAYKARVLR